MNRKRILQLQDFNPHLVCSLCKGYFIDATTIIECLHSFCRACIVRYLETNRFCPVCDVQIHKSKPLLNIRRDPTLQALVYKLVPGLYQNEMRLRQEFSTQHPEAATGGTQNPSDLCIYTPDEYFSLTLEHWNANKDVTCLSKKSGDDSAPMETTPDAESPAESTSANGKRYLRCPAAVTVGHIHKLIRAKYGLDPSHMIQLLFKDEPLPDYLTLVDVAYIYKWKRKGPLSLSYQIFGSSHKRMKLDTLNEACEDSEAQLHLVPSDPSGTVGNNTIIEPQEGKPEPTEKNTDWQEVQLQISETGIMSVSGISLEHNNNLSTPNNNIFDNQTEVKSKNHIEKMDPVVSLPKYLTLVDSYCKNLDDSKQVERGLTMPKPKPTPTPLAGAGKQEAISPESNLGPKSKNGGKEPVSMVSNEMDTVPAESKDKNACLQNKNPKISNQNSKEPTDKIGVANGITPIKQADMQNLCMRQKVPEIPKLPKEIMKPTSDSHIARDSSRSNQINSFTKKESVYHQPSGSASSTTQKYQQNVVSKNSDAKNLTSTITSLTVPAVSLQSAKKDISPATMSYNTRKDSPKTWNPSFSKASYPISKTKPPVSGASVNNNAEVKTEKAPKFFKMRNMPRYLGNPASGVKPMYQLSDNSKTSQVESPAKSKNVIMKIDPKTLSPIMCVVTTSSVPGMSDGQNKSSLKSSLPSGTPRSETESTNCLTTVASCGLDPVKVPSEKGKPTNGNQVSSTITSTTTSTLASMSLPLANSKSDTPPVSSLKTSHSRSIAATSPSNIHLEYCNEGPATRSLHSSLPATSSTTTTSSSSKLSNAPNFSLNPATLNLLSSNLSFLPNASNFLYGNFSDFGPPLMRPGLNLSSCLGGTQSMLSTNSLVPPASSLPPGIGAYHSMPPSINMLFPHHRSSDRSTSNHAQVQTPAVQRIPASKGNSSAAGHKLSTTKKISVTGNKSNQSQSASVAKLGKNDSANESVSASSAIANENASGIVSEAPRADKLATNLNNNSILSAENTEKIVDRKVAVIDGEILTQKVVIMPNGVLDSSVCIETSNVLPVESSSDTRQKTEVVARKELKTNECEATDVKEVERPLTDISVTINTGDKHRNLSGEISDNNNKNVKAPSESVGSTSPIVASDVITKPCTNPR